VEIDSLNDNGTNSINKYINEENNINNKEISNINISDIEPNSYNLNDKKNVNIDEQEITEHLSYKTYNNIEENVLNDKNNYNNEFSNMSFLLSLIPEKDLNKSPFNISIIEKIIIE